MADGKQTTAPAHAVRTAARFAAVHGKPVRAVVENIGRAGARIVLVGVDGALGDIVLPDVASAQAVVAEVEHVESSGWDRDTIAALKIGSAHRHKMAGR